MWRPCILISRRRGRKESLLNSGDDDNVTPSLLLLSPSSLLRLHILRCTPLTRFGERENSYPGPSPSQVPLRSHSLSLTVYSWSYVVLPTRSPFPPSLPCPYKMTTVLRFYDACVAQYPLCTSAVFSLSLSVPLQANMAVVPGERGA